MDAEQLLRALGATSTLKGFHYAVSMIEQVEELPSALMLITKRLYPDTAKRFGTSAQAVEHDLRTMISLCWKRSDRAFLDEVAGTRLLRKPTNSEFLDMAAAYLRRQAKA